MVLCETVTPSCFSSSAIVRDEAFFFAEPNDPFFERKEHVEAPFRRRFEGLNLRIEELDELLQVAVHGTSEPRALI